MSYVTKENTQDIYPLSPTQKGMLFHYVYDMNTPVYFEQLAFTINGLLQVDAFQNAWEHLISTTPIFRTVFRWSKTKEPVQIVLKKLPPVFRMHDFSDLDKIQQDKKIQQFLEADKSTPFDLEEGPLIRLNLFRLDDSAHHFVWSHHHIIIDGWCLPIVLKDIFATYLAHVSGNPLPSPIRRPYRDYIAWYLQQDKDASQTFWKEKLGTLVEPTPLPKDREPGETDSTGVGLETLLLGEDVSDALLGITKKERVTMNSLIQTAWAILLTRYSGMDDVVWGSTVSGRPVDLKGSEDMIGLFINTLPVRAIITEDLTVSDLIQSVQDFSLGMREYEYSLLPEVKACSAIPKSQNLFESIVVFENYPVDTVSMDDSKFGISNVKNFEMTNFPLTLLIAPGKRLSLDMHYHKAFFDETTIKRMMLHLQQIMLLMVTNVKAKVCQLDILTRQEREKILYRFNDTTSPYPEDVCPYQLFEEQVKLTPDRVAVEFEGRVVTYRELNERVNQLAHYLRKKGVEPDAKVGLLLDRSFEMLTGILGIHKAGGSYVPMDPEYPKTRLEYMLKDSESPVLVTQRSLLDLISNREANTVLLDDDWKEIEQESTENPEPWAKPGNLSHLIYTSGSTGQPKGVMIEHRNVAAFLAWAKEEFEYREYEEMIASTSMCFDLSVFEFFLPLISGAKVIILRSSLDLDEFLTSNSATMINTVPSALKHLLSVMKKRHKIRAVNLAGEPLKLELVRDAYEKLDMDLVRNLYGPTEDTTYSTNFRIPKGYDKEPLIGKPISNTTAFILDKHLNPVPVGVIGEIYLAGADLARGYWNAPEKTAERYIPNPFFADKYPYMYKTGDLGCWLPDGNIEFHGRVDYQVKIRGNRIELGEIETRLSIHPMIKDVAVIDRDDRDGDKYLVAYYVADEELSTTELRAFIKEELPEYMVPSRFILMDALPLSPNGKIDRKALPQLDSSRPEMASDYIEPRNDLEQTLAKVWQDILGVERVGINDNFFDLGGHSLLIMKVLAKFQFEYPLSVQDFFDYQNIAELSAVCAERMAPKKEDDQPELKHEEHKKIAVTIPISGKKEQPRNVLLTGSTGYLGAHLLYELLQETDAHIYCFIRGDNDEHIQGRLKSIIEFYFPEEVIDRERITVVQGDLTQDNLGLGSDMARTLSNTIDTFMHAAADVRHFGEYAHFRNINVLGTSRLLDFAKKGNCKRFHHVSTMGISGDNVPGMSQMIFKEDDYDRGQILDNVYARSKFEAEGFVRDSGLDATIYRVGMLVGDSLSGRFQRNIESNAFYGLLKTMIHMGVVLDRNDAMLEMTPIDACRKAIVKLMMIPETEGRQLHIFNPNYISIPGIASIVSSLGYVIKTFSENESINFVDVPREEETEQALENLMPHISSLSSPKTNVLYDNTITQYFLDSTGFRWPEVDRNLIDKLISYCVYVGFIKEPPKNKSVSAQ